MTTAIDTRPTEARDLVASIAITRELRRRALPVSHAALDAVLVAAHRWADGAPSVADMHATVNALHKALETVAALPMSRQKLITLGALRAATCLLPYDGADRYAAVINTAAIAVSRTPQEHEREVVRLTAIGEAAKLAWAARGGRAS